MPSTITCMPPHRIRLHPPIPQNTCYQTTPGKKVLGVLSEMTEKGQIETFKAILARWNATNAALDGESTKPLGVKTCMSIRNLACLHERVLHYLIVKMPGYDNLDLPALWNEFHAAIAIEGGEYGGLLGLPNKIAAYLENNPTSDPNVAMERAALMVEGCCSWIRDAFTVIRRAAKLKEDESRFTTPHYVHFLSTGIINRFADFSDRAMIMMMGDALLGDSCGAQGPWANLITNGPILCHRRVFV